jgi:hypothetical protein
MEPVAVGDQQDSRGDQHGVRRALADICERLPLTTEISRSWSRRSVSNAMPGRMRWRPSYTALRSIRSRYFPSLEKLTFGKAHTPNPVASDW